MFLATQRLIIRDVQNEDAILFAAMAADGSLYEIGFEKDCGRWMAEWIEETVGFALRDDPGMDYLAYTIALKDGTVIGSVGCSYYDDLRETGITYFIGAQYRKYGYAAEAVRAYSKYFFQHYPVPRLIATVREENTASRRVVEKAGFRLTAKKMYKDINDAKEEPYCFYAITNELRWGG